MSPCNRRTLSKKKKKCKNQRTAHDTIDALLFTPETAYEINTLDRSALYAPAYGLTSGTGPQCSGSSDFCFFCTFECEPSTVGTDLDLFGAMKSMVSSMVQQRRDFTYIVNAVVTAYNNTVKSAVTYTNEDGVVVNAPTWTAKSVARHLLYSLEHESIFNSAITNMYRAIITNINASLVDVGTGEVVDEKRVALLDTISAYSKWEKSRMSTGLVSRT